MSVVLLYILCIRLYLFYVLTNNISDFGKFYYQDFT